jgi:hypothetical protein
MPLGSTFVCANPLCGRIAEHKTVVAVSIKVVRRFMISSYRVRAHPHGFVGFGLNSGLIARREFFAWSAFWNRFHDDPN